jgi:MarR family transcriptional regulator, transcriptional regulator for hemolysin
MKPDRKPIGLLLVQTAKAVARNFEDALNEKGGSRPVWLILLALMDGEHRTQADLAVTIGVQGPTLTHHLTGMERDGLLTRTRLPENRRVQVVELTAKGRALFLRLRQAVVSFDTQLNGKFSETEMDQLRELLGRLGASDTVGFGPGV